MAERKGIKRKKLAECPFCNNTFYLRTANKSQKKMRCPYCNSIQKMDLK